jgi:cyclic pyranopterin phosphate synthase
MNDVDFPVSKVLEGIDAAAATGLGPIKINMVVKRGVNEASLVPMARWAREEGLTLRVIEFMDVGHSNGWEMAEVVTRDEILAAIGAAYAFEPEPPAYPGEVATRFRYRDGAGEFGVIASVTGAFCRSCTRARLSADGHLYTCLFAASGLDLKTPLRVGESDDQLRGRIRAAWELRGDRYSELRAAGTRDLPRIEMWAIGG